MVVRPTQAIHDRLKFYFADCDDKQLQTINTMAKTMDNTVGRWIIQQIQKERSERSTTGGK